MKQFVNGLKLTIQKYLAIIDLKNHADALDKLLHIKRIHDQIVGKWCIAKGSVESGIREGYDHGFQKKFIALTP